MYNIYAYSGHRLTAKARKETKKEALKVYNGYKKSLGVTDIYITDKDGYIQEIKK